MISVPYIAQASFGEIYLHVSMFPTVLLVTTHTTHTHTYTHTYTHHTHILP